MAEVLAGEQSLASKEAPMAELCSGLLPLNGPGGHILGLAKPDAAAESAVDVDDGLGVTKPSVFERSRYGESLVPMVWGYRGDAAMALPPDLCVCVVNDDGG